MGGEPYLRFVTATQRVYGDRSLNTVASEARAITAHLGESGIVPLQIRPGAVVTTADAVRTLCREANRDDACAGIIFWSHNRSERQLRMEDLSLLAKPYVELRPHGAGERSPRTGSRGAQAPVLGAPRSTEVATQIAAWARGVQGARALTGARVASLRRPQIEAAGEAVPDSQVRMTVQEYQERYTVDRALREDNLPAIEQVARLERGALSLLETDRYTAFTFLPAVEQLPGLLVQRLMEQGYGYAPEGDQHTAMLVGALKRMGNRMDGGTSFLDYQGYQNEQTGMTAIGAHASEICPTLAADRPKLIVPRRPGGTAASPRLVFPVAAEQAVTAARCGTTSEALLVVNTIALERSEVDAGAPSTRLTFRPDPDQQTASACWHRAGASGHMAVTTQLSLREIETAARIAGLDPLLIDRGTKLRGFRQSVRAAGKR